VVAAENGNLEDERRSYQKTVKTLEHTTRREEAVAEANRRR